jgi:hypothetical protein
MSKLKTEFELEYATGGSIKVKSGLMIRIIGSAPDNQPYVSIELGRDANYFIKDSDLELFAVNILKALKSKRLK